MAKRPVDHARDAWMREQTSTTQQDLANWQWRNFGAQKVSLLALGASEESGELAEALIYAMGLQARLGALCRCALKQEQSIRGMDDQQKFLHDIGDAIADCSIFLTQICDVLKLDFVTLWATTASMVMTRDWRRKDDE